MNSLEVFGVNKVFGDLAVLQEIDLTLQRGSSVPSSVPRAAARAPCCAWWPASSSPIAARWPWTASPSPAPGRTG